MIRSEVRVQLEELFGSQQLGDRGWLEALKEIDEVPLFLRYADVEFLREVPESLRGRLVFDCALAELDKLAVTLDSLERSSNYFACLTFLDFEDVGVECLVPTPCVLVSPNWKDEMPSPSFRRPESTGGQMVVRWKRTLGRTDVCVADGPQPMTEDEPPRVHLGYEAKVHRFRSVGDFGLSD